MWPRDALYICYKEQQFEFVIDAEAQGDPTYYCDCCDPSRNKKRGFSDSESEGEGEGELEDSEGEDEDLEEDLDDEEKSNSGDSVKTLENNKTENNIPKPLQPGWFGKGRRKRARC